MASKSGSHGNNGESRHRPVTRNPARPVFAQPEPTEDPTHFRIKHASDAQAYKAIDRLNAEHKLKAMAFPAPRGGEEPQLTLEQVLGGIDSAPDDVKAQAGKTCDTIQKNGQIVFHALGDCGSTRGPASENLVVDKLLGDFKESDPMEVPQFHFLLGDIVYSFGEPQYYYDQFYEPYRDYPAPILAAAGNHDGMISPLHGAKSLEAYLRNFCAEDFAVTPEAGGLSRTAQIQPGVFFTFEAPFLRIVTLYSNTLEDPGVIADDDIGDSQLIFLKAALERAKAENYEGALLFVDHHPPYTAGGQHGWSIEMSNQIDKICEETGVWPHAFLSGHAHNYQRFTRTRNADKTQIPYIICGNGGHAHQALSKSGGHTIRAPQVIQKSDTSHDLVVLENYDDQDYGYLRVIASDTALRIEYHPASDGTWTKAPDDFVTVDLKTRKIVHYHANDLGHPKARAEVARQAAHHKHS
ncbi:MAG TPA: metallophosphoesterase [Rhizomicrobium sp.]|nr:metallophosphoesterase [Rhizomicrobium sp.]